MNLDNEIRIIPYEPAYQPHFERLNRSWLDKYSLTEPVDIAVLQNPDRQVIAGGGHIIFASVQNHIAGTVGLIKVDEETVELIKMAVDEAYQGRKIGQTLAEAIIQVAREKGFRRIVLYSNTQLKAALQLYRKLGFREIPVEPGHYRTCDIRMELWLDAPLLETARGLEQTIALAVPQLQQYTAIEAALRPAPGKWSKKEILGHLVDSAINNQARFVRLQQAAYLEMPGYEQNFWVSAQGYQQAEWPALIQLWEAINLNLVRVIQYIPSATIQHTCKIGSHEPVTLEYIVHDYLAHLHHHLRQLQVHFSVGPQQ